MLSYETTYPYVKSNAAVLKRTKSVEFRFRNQSVTGNPTSSFVTKIAGILQPSAVYGRIL